MKQQCPHCRKKFKRLKSHLRFCRSGPRNYVFTDKPEPLLFSQRDLHSAMETSFKRGVEETTGKLKSRLDDVQIKALDSAAKAVDAIAHMVSDLRIRG